MAEQGEQILLESLKRHLSLHWAEEKPWILRQTANYGRAIFATRDIQPNEVIFHDFPVLIGPIGNAKEPVICVACYKILDPIELCLNECGLPMCSECPNKRVHRLECELYKKWQPRSANKISFTKVRFLTAVRSLFLADDEKKLMLHLQKNDTAGSLIEEFISEFDNFPKNVDILTDLKKAVEILNTNAFKMLINGEYNKNVSVKALLPLTSLMNHCCTPNTRHDNNGNFLQTTSAVNKISKGDQILTTYSQILWSTSTRRMHLMLTKQFCCTCDRCRDATENGTFMSGLRCSDETCKGVVLSSDPLNLNAPWVCNICAKVIGNQQVLRMQDVFGAMVKNFFQSEHSVEEVVNFIEKRLSVIMSATNQFVVEAKLNAIWQLSDLRKRGDTALARLKAAESFCLDILEILERLKTGLCTTKGFLCYELFKTRQLIKELGEQCSNQLIQFEDFGLGLQNFDEYLQRTTCIILRNSAIAPIDFEMNA